MSNWHNFGILPGYEKFGSLKFQVGRFKGQHLDPKELVNVMLKDLGKEFQGFSSWEEAVDWLNNSILPYNLLINGKLDKNIQELLGQIEKNTGKKLSEFTNDELKNTTLLKIPLILPKSI